MPEEENNNSHVYPPPGCIGCANLIPNEGRKETLPEPPCYDDRTPPKDPNSECKFYLPANPSPDINLP